MGLTQHKLDGVRLVLGHRNHRHTPPPSKATSHLLSGAGDEGTTLRAAGSKTSAHGRTCQALLHTPQRDSWVTNPFYRWGDYSPKR